MKKLFNSPFICSVICILSFVTGLAVLACNKNEAEKNHTDRFNDFVGQHEAGKLHYFKDNRTGQCFAFIWGGGFNGGPGLATVPCEKVEKFLEPGLEIK